jgi:hypothetical protein
MLRRVGSIRVSAPNYSEPSPRHWITHSLPRAASGVDRSWRHVGRIGLKYCFRGLGNCDAGTLNSAALIFKVSP